MDVPEPSDVSKRYLDSYRAVVMKSPNNIRIYRKDEPSLDYYIGNMLSLIEFKVFKQDIISANLRFEEIAETRKNIEKVWHGTIIIGEHGSQSYDSSDDENTKIVDEQ